VEVAQFAFHGDNLATHEKNATFFLQGVSFWSFVALLATHAMPDLTETPQITSKIQVLKTLAMTLAVLAKSTNDPELRIAASEEERDVKARIITLEETANETAA